MDQIWIKKIYLNPIFFIIYIYLYQTNQSFMTIVIISAVAAVIGYLLLKSKSIKKSVSDVQHKFEDTVSHLQEAVSPVLKDVEEIIEKAEVIAPVELKAEIAQAKSVTKEVKTVVSKKPVAKPVDKKKPVTKMSNKKKAK